MNFLGQAERTATEGRRPLSTFLRSYESLQLCSGPQAYMEAATFFYRALRNYPLREELLAVYSRTIPRPIYMVNITLLFVRTSLIIWFKDGSTITQP